MPVRAAALEASAHKFCWKSREKTGAPGEETPEGTQPGATSRVEGQRGSRADGANGREKEAAVGAEGQTRAEQDGGGQRGKEK